MTGFGKSFVDLPPYRFDIEVKSVNNRFLEMSLKIPSSLQDREYDFRELIRKNVMRGKIYLVITIKSSGQVESPIQFNSTRVSALIDTLYELRQKYKIKENVKISHLLAYKDILTSDIEGLDENKFEILKSGVAEALQNLEKMKKAEGAELKKDLLQRLAVIESALSDIENIYHSDVQQHLERLREKVKELLRDIAPFNERLETELAINAEKVDITEECVRLKSHIKYFLQALQEESEPGRKLNFLCQELNREANTIASKSISTEVSYKSVIIKEEIERIREQVQNIE